MTKDLLYKKSEVVKVIKEMGIKKASEDDKEQGDTGLKI
jgi:hypothetical protein